MFVVSKRKLVQFYLILILFILDTKLDCLQRLH